LILAKAIKSYYFKLLNTAYRMPAGYLFTLQEQTVIKYTVYVFLNLVHY
jgi:hypothetical protein